MAFSFLVLVAVSVAVLDPADARADDSTAEAVDFASTIRPILSDKCFRCHGPDENSREADLRLDVEEAAKEYAVVAGEPDESLVLERMISEDPDEQMPPPDSGKSVTEDEIDLIRRWIEQGAPFQSHWSLVPPRRPELPEVKDPRWAWNAIDYFVLARLEREGLAPSPEADRITLLRRVTLDLTGLPPTPDEIDAFVADKAPDAYEKVVDRLLRSPRYGEHMARFWLDAARYGDTHGLHLDNFREMWPYRDWVVHALNRNQPYDQFVIEQVAGDLLPDPTMDQLIATGFNRCHVTTSEGGSIEEEVYVRNVVDRVVTFGTVFMGLTLECTRCHDHKYDPVTMDDFYSLFAFFNSLDGKPLDGNAKNPAPVLRVPTPQQQQQLAELDGQITVLQTRLQAPWPAIDALQDAWEQQLREDHPVESEPDVTFGDWYVVGPFPGDRQQLNQSQQGPEGSPINLDAAYDVGDTPLKWRTRADWSDGQVHADLTGDAAANFLYRKITASQARSLTVSLGSDDGIKVYLNNQSILANDVARGVAADQDQVELKLVEGENHLLVKIMNYGGASGFYFARQDQPVMPPAILELVRTDPAARGVEQQQNVRDYFREKVAQADALNEARTQLKQRQDEKTKLEQQVATTLIWRERKESRPAYYLKRGEYDQRGQQLSRRTPNTLPPMDAELPLDRLGLARWMVEPEHPLTARVAVNRYWQQLFGTGIVKTAEDFGSQGEAPSHPQLLDWLVMQFIADGWDIKATMKRMVMSATYRQSSRVTRALQERDPRNRLLARGPRFRLDAEMLRDQALFTSGLLVEQMGGPSVKPPQPDGLWFAVGYSGSNTVRFVADEGPDKVHRRTLYTFIKRTSPPPQMSTLDAPSREACTVRRERTNTPLQALLLLNDPQYVEAARALAERTLREAGSDVPSRADYMFRLCTARQPDDWERKQLVREYQEHLAAYQSDPKSAAELTQMGELPESAGIEDDQLAAWMIVANLVLNLDEVVNKN